MADKTSLAKAIGTTASGSNRSRYLIQALAGMQASANNVRSPAEAVARALAMGITGRQIRKDDEAQTAKTNAREAQVQQLLQQTYGNDPQALAAAQIDPSSAMAGFWKGREPQTLSQGSTLVQGGKPVYTAPQMGVTGAGQGYSIGPQGMRDMGSLAPTQQQQWGQGNADRDFNLHQAAQQLQERLGQQNANAALMGAGASQQNAATNRMEYEARVKQGGFGTPGAAVPPWNMQWGQ